MNVVSGLENMGLKLTISGGPGVMRGPCPVCGGEDRLAVWVETGGFHCRRCLVKGSFRRLVELVMGLDPAAAAAKVREYADAEGDTPSVEVDMTPNEVIDPGAWQKTVWSLIEDGEKDIADNKEALSFLHDERGLNRETIHRYHLGYIQRYPPLWRSSFGLKPSYQRSDGTKGWKVVIPDGVIVPLIVRGRGVVSVTIRCWDAIWGRYRSLTGSKPEARHIAATSDEFGGVVVVVESALCGMKLSQDTGVAVVALGGVNAPLGEQAVQALDDAEIIVLALDDDPAGMEAARGYEAKYSQAVYVTAPGGKDVTDAWRNIKLDLKKFIAAAVRYSEGKLRERGYHETVPNPLPTRGRVPSAPPAAPRVVPPALPSVAVEPVVAVCPQSRGFRHIADVAEALSAVRLLASENNSVAINVKTAKMPEWNSHPKAGADPALSKLRLVALCGPRGDAVLIDGDACSGALPEIMAPLLSCQLVAHDAVHVTKHLAHAGFTVAVIESTQLMWNAITSETTDPEHKDPANKKLQVLSLDSVLRRAVGVDIAARERQASWDVATLTPEQLHRAAMEVHHLTRLHEELGRRLRMEGVDGVYALQRAAIPAIVQIESNGMPFRVAEHAALVADWRQQLEAVRAELPQGMDLRTRKGMDAALREILPPELTEHETGLLSSSKEAMAAYGEIPGLATLRAWKTLDKLVSAYGDDFAAAVSPDGRIRSAYELAGTVSGRLSSHGPALQNIPRDRAFRALFAPESEGNVFVVADMSQAELRVAACLSGETNMIRAYEAGHDLHRETASRLLGIPLDTVTKDQRTWGRVVNLALSFGQSAKGFKDYAFQNQGLEMTLEQAKETRDAFLAAYPQLERFQREMVQLARNLGQVRTPGGRVRRFEPGDRKAFTAAINHPVQGGLAEIFLHILCLLPGRLEGIGRLVNVVHDEVVVECSREASDAIVTVIEETMADGFCAVFPSGCVRNLTEAKVCNTWAEAK